MNRISDDVKISRAGMMKSLFALLMLSVVAAAAAADAKITPYSFNGDVSSRSFTVTVNGTAIPVAEVPALEAAERQQLAEAYLKMPSYCHIYDPACMHLHFAYLATNADAEVDIRVQQRISEFNVFSATGKIAATASGNVLRFRAMRKQQPRYFIIRIDQLPPLMLAIERQETIHTGSSSVVDAGRFLSDSTGTIDQTECLQKAFNAVNGSGRILYIPAGVYLIDQLHIVQGHNFAVYLAPGCQLRVRPSVNRENHHRHGLWLQDCRHLSIQGPGCIDQQAYEHYVVYHNNYQHGMVDYYTSNELCPWISQSPLFITGSQHIVIDGLVIRNGRNFNINARGCDDLTLRHIKILTPPACTPEYADGINTSSCRHVLVEDVLVACNDDCFASGHYFDTWDHRASADHVVRRMLGWNMRADAVRLGFYSAFDQGDFTFEECCFVAMPFGSILIHALRPQEDGRISRYGTIRLRDCTFANTEQLKVLFSVERAAIEKLELINVRFEGEPLKKARFTIAGDSTLPIGQFVLDRVYFDGKIISRIDELPAKLQHIARIAVK